MQLYINSFKEIKKHLLKHLRGGWAETKAKGNVFLIVPTTFDSWTEMKLNMEAFL